MIYVGVLVNIDPDGKELLFGPFDDAVERGQWYSETARGKARQLSIELGIGGEGITVTTWLVESLDGALEATNPSEFARVVRNIYRDVYATP